MATFSLIIWLYKHACSNIILLRHLSEHVTQPQLCGLDQLIKLTHPTCWGQSHLGHIRALALLGCDWCTQLSPYVESSTLTEAVFPCLLGPWCLLDLVPLCTNINCLHCKLSWKHAITSYYIHSPFIDINVMISTNLHRWGDLWLQVELLDMHTKLIVSTSLVNH